MKALGWYSTIVVTISIVTCLIQAITGTDAVVNWWAVAFYVPIGIFLWKYSIKKS